MDYPGSPKLSIKVLKRARKRWKSRSRRVSRTGGDDGSWLREPLRSWREDARRGREPRNAGGLSHQERQRNGFLPSPRASRRERSPAHALTPAQ